MRAIATIAHDVARFRGVTFADIVSQRRSRTLIQPRHEAFYLARTLTTASLPQIASSLGGRDHTTVLHGCRSIENRQRIEPGYLGEIAAMKAEIREHLRQASPSAGSRGEDDELIEALRRILALEREVAARDATLEELRSSLRQAESHRCCAPLVSPTPLFKAFRTFETERFGKGEALATRRLFEALTEFRTAFNARGE